MVVSSAAEARAASQSRLRWELLSGLVRKDLKVKYKDSVLGFAWSLANPLLLMAVYYFAFGLVLKSPIPYFVVYLMSGLLVWTFFQGSVLGAVGSVVGNGNLIKKVRFPLTVLPLSAVGFAGVHFGLQMVAFLGVLALVGYHFVGLHLLLLIPAVVVALVFTTGLSVLVSALNVRYRDVQHVIEVTLTAWFWLNPIIYSAGLLRSHISPGNEWVYRLYFCNPLAIVSASFQRAIYAQPYYAAPGAGRTLLLADPGYAFFLQQLGLVLVGSVVLLWVALVVFRRLQGNFAEEL